MDESMDVFCKRFWMVQTSYLQPFLPLDSWDSGECFWLERKFSEISKKKFTKIFTPEMTACLALINLPVKISEMRWRFYKLSMDSSWFMSVRNSLSGHFRFVIGSIRFWNLRNRSVTWFRFRWKFAWNWSISPWLFFHANWQSYHKKSCHLR